MHLTDGEIRHAICEHLRAQGYVGVKPDTLRIYGYGETSTPQLSSFQGHIVAFTGAEFFFAPAQKSELDHG